ncbi:uncharacterized protein B0I36DRAFT_359062 [Microdochium trichocladiopsis]|uniref:Calcineurin-like phosphoesterase domain-containing protein n=1 Tax=Microdochium trichocladiopsis TaxID=1682393 RepID=A0A9P9BUD2_9PEZI|nr:uncharacterized protein B0I36DRAFT_359062 [Microdochium trichocladiopsis]KAH7037349.1 hypothetical protein B0I36DRAFT_359062 [Microdochium trichocladiopsis]
MLGGSSEPLSPAAAASQPESRETIEKFRPSSSAAPAAQVLPRHWDDLADEKRQQRHWHEAVAAAAAARLRTITTTTLTQPQRRDPARYPSHAGHRHLRRRQAAILLFLTGAAALVVVVVVLGCGLTSHLPFGSCPLSLPRQQQQQQQQHFQQQQHTAMSGQYMPSKVGGGDNNGDQDYGVQQQRWAQDGESYLENRPTRDATLNPRKVADLPARYLPGYGHSSDVAVTDTTTNPADTSGADDALASKKRPSSSSPPHHPPWKAGRPRVIIIGDVHGELEILEDLLRKVGYTPRAQGGRDHVILAGDIINKGPDTPGVLDLAIREGFSGVRGNHDDYLLRLFDEHGPGKQKGKMAVVDDGAAVSDEDGESDSRGSIDEEEDEDEDEDEDDNDEESISNMLGDTSISRQQQHSLGGSNADGDDNDHDTSSGDAAASKKHKKHGKHKHKGKKKKHKKGKKKIPKKDRLGLAIIRSCTPEQRRWLANLPLILRVGHIPHTTTPTTSLSADLGSDGLESSVAKLLTPYGGQMVVVHGGLVPGIALEKQDPWALLHMRTLLLEKKEKKQKHGKKKGKDNKHKRESGDHEGRATANDSAGTTEEEEGEDDNVDNDADAGPITTMTPLETREGKPWARVWDKFQRKHVASRTDRTTVVFGHDAKAGLQIGEYSFGLDTGCVAGGKLTAMVFFEAAVGIDADESTGPREEGVVRVAHEFYSVSCKERAA